MRTLRRGVLFLAAFALVAGSAHAQSGTWKNTAELYFMGAAMSGTSGVGPIEAEVNLSASQILENLQFAALANYRGEAPKWAISADVVFMGLGATRDGTHGLLTTKVDADQWIVNGTVSWRLSEAFEVLAGARFTSLALKLVLTPITGNVRTADVTKSWVDPIVGARAVIPVGRKWSLEGTGDVGGFGVGSDLTWQLTGRVNWRVSESVALGLGYRALYQDYETGEGADRFAWKVTSHGPLGAMNISF